MVAIVDVYMVRVVPIDGNLSVGFRKLCRVKKNKTEIAVRRVGGFFLVNHQRVGITVASFDYHEQSGFVFSKLYIYNKRETFFASFIGIFVRAPITRFNDRVLRAKYRKRIIFE